MRQNPIQSWAGLKLMDSSGPFSSVTPSAGVYPIFDVQHIDKVTTINFYLTPITFVFVGTDGVLHLFHIQKLNSDQSHGAEDFIINSIVFNSRFNSVSLPTLLV